MSLAYIVSEIFCSRSTKNLWLLEHIHYWELPPLKLYELKNLTELYATNESPWNSIIYIVSDIFRS